VALPTDCLGLIIEYLDTRDWIQFSYTCKAINALKYVECLMVNKPRTIVRYPTEDTLDSIRSAHGTLFNVVFGSRHWIHLTDDYFEPLAGTIRELNMRSCIFVTDAAFKHLKGIRVLDMSQCKQNTITNAAFAHLADVEVLAMQWCTQSTITDEAFQGLKKLVSLDISCTRFTDSTLSCLEGIHTLKMSRCHRITDAGFKHLKGIHTLDMYSCNQRTVTDAAFEHLKGVHTLDMSHCNQETITDKAFAHLGDIHTLIMSHCHQETISHRAFEHLKSLRVLDVTGCNRETVTHEMCSYLDGCAIEHNVLTSSFHVGALSGGVQKLLAMIEKRQRRFAMAPHHNTK
jgi:hypothetical protein